MPPLTWEEGVDLGQLLVTHPEELLVKPGIVPSDHVLLCHLGRRSLLHSSVQHRLWHGASFSASRAARHSLFVPHSLFYLILRHFPKSNEANSGYSTLLLLWLLTLTETLYIQYHQASNSKIHVSFEISGNEVSTKEWSGKPSSPRSWYTASSIPAWCAPPSAPRTSSWLSVRAANTGEGGCHYSSWRSPCGKTKLFETLYLTSFSSQFFWYFFKQEFWAIAWFVFFNLLSMKCYTYSSDHIHTFSITFTDVCVYVSVLSSSV